MRKIFIGFILLFIGVFPAKAGKTRIVLHSFSDRPESVTLSNGWVLPPAPLVSMQMQPRQTKECEVDIPDMRYYTLLYGGKQYVFFMDPGKDFELELHPAGKMMVKGAYAGLNNFLMKVQFEDTVAVQEGKKAFFGTTQLDNKRFDVYTGIYESQVVQLKNNHLPSGEEKLAMGCLQGMYLKNIYKLLSDSKIFGKTYKITVAGDYARPLVKLKLVPELVYYPGWGDFLREWMYTRMAAGKVQLKNPHFWIAEWAKSIPNPFLREHFVDYLTEREVVMKYFDSYTRERFESAKRLVKDPEIVKRLDERIAQIPVQIDCPDAAECVFEDVQGEKVALGVFKGKYVFIDFWGLACSPCIGELPYFHALAENFKGKKIEFISIALERNRGNWKAFLQKRQLEGNQFIMPDLNRNPIWEKIGLSGIPRFVLVGPDSKVLIKSCYRPSNLVLGVQLQSFLQTK